MKDFIRNPSIHPEKQEEYLGESIKSYIRYCGWGIFNSTFDRELFTVNLIDPPVLEVSGSILTGGNFLRGLIAGFMESTEGDKREVEVTGQFYDKGKKILTVYLAKTKLSSMDSIKADAGHNVKESQEGSDHPEMSSNQFSDIVSSFGVAPITSVSLAIPASSSVANVDLSLGNPGIVKKILTDSKAGARKLSIMNSAKITWSDANQYLERLMHAHLLGAKTDPMTDATVYFTTEMGLGYLEIHEKSQQSEESERK